MKTHWLEAGEYGVLELWNELPTIKQYNDMQFMYEFDGFLGEALIHISGNYHPTLEQAIKAWNVTATILAQANP